MSEIAVTTVAPVIGDETESAVAWGAVFAGAVAALAMTVVVASLAAGFGLGSGGPWPGTRLTTDDFNPTVGAAMVAAQVLSAMLGGYLAGRLRTKWKHVHTHEVFFRDTAHGLLVWALATTIMTALSGLTLAHPGADATVATGREAALASQFAFFLGVGLLLSAFAAAVAAAIGGMRRDDLHTLLRKA